MLILFRILNIIIRYERSQRIYLFMKFLDFVILCYIITMLSVGYHAALKFYPLNVHEKGMPEKYLR